jgi:hypothetical protein
VLAFDFEPRNGAEARAQNARATGPAVWALYETQNPGRDRLQLAMKSMV